MCKYPCCLVGGMVLGATLGMMVFPQLDRRTQRSMREKGLKYGVVRLWE